MGGLETFPIALVTGNNSHKIQQLSTWSWVTLRSFGVADGKRRGSEDEGIKQETDCVDILKL